MHREKIYRSTLTASLNLLAAAIILLMSGCKTPSYSVFQYDNGDDYLCEGLRRIVDKHGRIGFADSIGNVVITPKYAFAFPFEDGRAKATFTGESVAEGEHSRWVSSDWFYIDRNGQQIR